MASLGYVRAEEVVGVRNPTYNEDNLQVETLRMMGDLRRIQAVDVILLGPRVVHDIRNYEAATRRMISGALNRVG
jgi:cellobiose-specific phosphotransferase system component IIB